MKKILKGLLASMLSVSVLAAGTFTGAAQENEFEGEEVRVGVVGEEAEEIWKFVAEKAAEEGITIEVEMLTDYNIPNEALSDGSLDMNAFQHDDFLDNWNNENDGSLVNIGYTNAVPIRIYSQEYDSLDALSDGAKIAVNSAPTSLSYNLETLERAGLIKLEESDELLPTPENVVENPKNIEFVELDGAQIPAALPDVDAAFIDDSFLEGTDFVPADAIYVFGDTPETINLRRVNNIVVREEDKENPLYLHIVELYQAEDTAEVISEVSKGGQIPAWDIVAEALENE